MTMFDQVLAKPAFVKTLTDNGVPQEKIDEQWAKIEKLFLTAFCNNLLHHLSESELRNITVNLNPDKPEEVQTAIRNLAAFLKDNPSKIPPDLVGTSVKETYDQYEKSLIQR